MTPDTDLIRSFLELNALPETEALKRLLAALDKPALLTPKQVDEDLYHGIMALIEENTKCTEAWDGPCGYDDRPDGFHICMEDRGHEGQHACPCGVTR